MTKSRVSPYRMLSFLAVAATSVLVACAPDDSSLLESAATSCSQFERTVMPSGSVEPIQRMPGPLT